MENFKRKNDIKNYLKKVKKKSNNKGITLIALVITIIVLLILAGVSLGMVLNQNGIFSRAEQATDKYGQAKARETLELVLDEFQMTKYEEGLSGQTYENRLDSKIAEVGSLLPKEDENSNYQLVIVEGHIFEIDRSVPKIVDYKGPANGVIVTAKITQNGDWQNPVATVTGTITKYGGGSVTSSTATAKAISTGSTSTITNFPTTGGSYIISSITEDTDITITASADDGKPAVTKTIKVRLVRDTTPPTLSEIDTTGSVGLTIKFKATATDNESGLKETRPLHYEITPTTGLTTSTGDFNSGETVELTSTIEETYTITIKATDKAGNTTNPGVTATVKTVEGGVIKHIKLSDGTLKAVNTKDIYGATVNGYICLRDSGTDTNVNKPEWQIFYIDEEDDHRVYLISKDYMEPPTIRTDLTKGNTSYTSTYCWPATVLNNYTGTIPNTRFTQKFLRDYANTSASAKNLQATNYMLDQTKWSEYASTNNKSEFVFGGPTLSLFQASYNDICKAATKLEIRKNGTGYEVKRGTGSYNYGVDGFGYTNTQKGIYFKGKDNSGPADAMWIASPSTVNSERVMVSSWGGSVSSNSYVACNGFRPIVSLQSNTQFTSNADGTVYTIAN